MGKLRKIIVSVPANLLEEVDCLVCNEKKNRSELIREAVRLYIDCKRKNDLVDQMKKGYEEMAEINLKLAEMCFQVDCEGQNEQEVKLAECE